MSENIHSASQETLSSSHTHQWMLMDHIYVRDDHGWAQETLLIFVCHCGAAKRVKQFEVEE